MSHLTTICERVEGRLAMYKGNAKEASRDALFRQSVRNLVEYQDAWTDYTKEEQSRASILYMKYAHLCRE